MNMQTAITFTSRRKRLPVLVLNTQMQRDAWQIDRDRAALRRDMREVHRIEAEARRVTLAHLCEGI
ncbi:MAG: hypothetical protein ACLGIP_16690 [Alphaproteobacteria bacterium]